MSLGIVGQAVVLFAVTNVDDILILALFFGQGGTTRSIALGQYLGFAAILAVAGAAAFGATFLPDSFIPYLGILPIALGIKAAIQAWRGNDDEDIEQRPKALEIAAVTFANGGDNIGVYVPVFATAGIAGMGVYVLVFLILVAVWVVAGRYFATRPAIAKALARWGHVLLPIVLIGIGVLILVGGL